MPLRLPPLLLGAIWWAALAPLRAQPALDPITLEDRLAGLAAGEALPELDHAAVLYAARPSVHLNRADAEDLRATQLFSERQIQALLHYRAFAGPLHSRYELQAIPFFDTAFIRRLWPRLQITGAADPLPLRRIGREGRGQITLRSGRTLERAQGYRSTPGRPPPYLGSPDRLNIRLTWRYGQNFSAGLTADKDPGEPLFGTPVRKGFDHYGVHFFLRPKQRWLQALALGDFRVSFGQGLLLHGGFGYGKGANASSIYRAGYRLRPHRSTAETGFLRGIAATWAWWPRVELTAFASRLRRTANRDRHGEVVTALSLSGLHRTAAERQDRRSTRQSTYGLSLRWKGRRGHVALNLLHDRLSMALHPAERTYNRFYFRGDRLTNFSLDYSLFLGRLHLFGESARAIGGGLAHLHGMRLGLGPSVDLALLYRNYSPDYHNLWSTGFGESSGTRNERGLYLGLVLRPFERWSLHAHTDTWTHPWPRFRVDAPSRGRGHRLRLTYRQKRGLHAYLEWRAETKAMNGPTDQSPLPAIVLQRQKQLRLHVEPWVHRSLRLRLRLDLGWLQEGQGARQRGLCLLQDVLYRPPGSPFQFTARFALIDTPGYGLRFYHYENGLLGTFAIRPYFHEGSRWYLNLRYRPEKAITIDLRLAQSYRDRAQEIGSGNDRIEGPRRTDVGAQLTLAF